MTDEQDSPAEPRLCSICNDPMIESQAFHGILLSATFQQHPLSANSNPYFETPLYACS